MADTTTTKKRDDITPLDFDHSYPTIPNTHTWDSEEEEKDSFLKVIDHHSSIPVVDMENPSATELIGRACHEWGAFQLTGHGVPLKLLHEVGVQSRRLFDLPTTQKLKTLRSSSSGAGSGSSAGEASGYGQPKISHFYPKRMWHEGFTISGDVAEHAAALWPHDHLHFCSVIEEYKREMRILAEKLFNSILQWLGVSPQEMCEKDDNNGGGQYFGVQLNSYPPCPEPEKAMGLVPHTDTSFLTVLHQVDPVTEGGLQVFQEGSGWVPVVPATDSSLVVNVGDLFHIISNGKLHQVLHRATVNSMMRRLSFAYFYFPPYISSLSSPPKLIGSCVPRMYRDVTVKEYGRLKQKHLRNTLSLIRN